MTVATGTPLPDSLPMPEDRENNFWYVRSSPDLVVVFLHGIFSKSRTCWLYEDADKKKRVFWPDLIRTDKRFGDPSIYMAGYLTAVDAGDFKIADCAREVLDALQRPEMDGQPPVLDARSIVFVCHSTGGIVARYLIERYKDLMRDKHIGLVLIASPSLGSVWANVGSLAARYYNNRLGLQLQWNGESLEELHGRFRDLVNKREIPGLVGAEASESKMVFRDKIPKFFRQFLPNRWKIVPTISAGQYFGDVKVLPDTDHFSTVKPHGFNHAAHDFFVTFMQDFRKTLPRETSRASTGVARLTPSAGIGMMDQYTSRVSVPTAVVANPFPAASPTQLTQIFINGLPQLSLGSQLSSPLSQEGFQLGPLTVRSAQAAVAQEAAPKPRLDELFEIVTDPDEVMKALYRTDQAAGLAPYDVEYVGAREDLPDAQLALERALRESKGRLLVTGLRGIGKTREIAELARSACAAKWKVLVARDDANGRIGLPCEMPAELADARVMLVIDNLHSRTVAGADQQLMPYVERLELLLRWLERHLPGSVRILATARDEPRFQTQLDLPTEDKHWRDFGVFHLPMLTTDGLRHILSTLAAQANVGVAADDIPMLIENSDRKPETVLINVNIARHKRTTLDKRTWRPTEGESWALRFGSARAEYAGVDRVCQVLHLLSEACLPARLPYVDSIARELGEMKAEQAVHALVGEGLLGLRQGVLTPYSPDQLVELAAEHRVQPITFRTSAEFIERAITDPVNRVPEWADDLLALSFALVSANDLEAAERVASHAVELGIGARAYRARAGVRFLRRDLRGAESDVTATLDAGGDEGDARFLRAVIRILLAGYLEALDDIDVVLRLGRDDSLIHLQRATAYYQLSRWAEAEPEYTAALEKGDNAGLTFFARAMVRFQMQNVEGTEQDLSAALERGVDLDRIANEFGEREDVEQFAALNPSGAGATSGSLLVRALRGFVRFRQGKNMEAEEDLTAAINGGVGDRFTKFAGTLKDSNVPMLTRAKGQIEEAQRSFGEAPLLHIRGLVRLNLDKVEEARVDFDNAIAMGFIDAEAYSGRGWARFRSDNIVGAEEDATKALDIGRDDGFTYALRGLARFALQRIDEAEQDLTKAIELGVSNAQILTVRGSARMQLQRFVDAEADLAAADVALSSAIDSTPDARTFYTRGCLRFDRQHYDKAESDLTKAQELGFAPAPLFFIRGSARLAQGNVAGADDDVRQAFELGLADTQTYSLRAAVRAEQGLHVEAEQDFTAAFDRGRQDAWLFFSRGKSRAALERYADAEADYDAIVAMKINDADVFVHRGQARLAQEKGDAAAEDFVAAIGAGRDDAFVHFELARARQMQKQYDAAESEFTTAIALDGRPVLKAARGILRLIRGQFSKAAEDLTDAIDEDPSDVHSMHARGLARFGQGDEPGALGDQDAVLNLKPTHDGALAARVVLSLRLGDLEKAATDCAQLEAINSENTETLGSWGALHLARAEAEAALLRFTSAAQSDNAWYFWQGLAYLMLGRSEEAREAYKHGTAECLPADTLLALNEFDFQLAAPWAQGLSDSARATAALIRSELMEIAAPLR